MTAAAALEWLSGALILTGIGFAIVGGAGLVRLPDFFSRMHAGGVTDTLGAGLVLVGLMLQSGLTLATFKLLTILFFLFVTSPTAAHALSKAALTSGLEPWTVERGGSPSKN